MKRLNKKGFTLIELLAVIIILGILMIIAIPSVTSYIQNSRKSAYVDTSVGYMDAVMKEVNGGKEFRLYSTDTLYMIPVGHVKGKSCVTVESGGQSPFDDTWNYAYVGVTYDGKGYNYYYLGEDGAGQGITMIDKKTLTDDGTDYLYSAYGTVQKTKKDTNSMSKAFSAILKGYYASTETSNIEHVVCHHYATEKEWKESDSYSSTQTEPSSCDSSTQGTKATDDEERGITKQVEEVEYKEGKTINKIIYVTSKNCSQKEQATA